MIKTKHVLYALGVGLIVLAIEFLSQKRPLGYIVGLSGILSLVLNYRANAVAPAKEEESSEE